MIEEEDEYTISMISFAKSRVFTNKKKK